MLQHVALVVLIELICIFHAGVAQLASLFALSTSERGRGGGRGSIEASGERGKRRVKSERGGKCSLADLAKAGNALIEALRIYV